MLTPKKPAINNAIKALYSVPQIAGRMPYLPWLTSQTLPKSTSKPCFSIPGRALRPTS